MSHTTNAMELENRHLEQIGDYVKSHIPEWMSNDNQLTERIIRVEEELKSQRELMLRGFETMDKRFNDLMHQIDKRFEQVDKRFESMDKRFESMDRQIENLSKGLRTFAYSSFSFTAAAAGVILAVLKFT